MSGLKSRPASLCLLPGAKPGCPVCLAARGFLSQKTPTDVPARKNGGWQGRRTQAGCRPPRTNAASPHLCRPQRICPCQLMVICSDLFHCILSFLTGKWKLERGKHTVAANRSCPPKLQNNVAKIRTALSAWPFFALLREEDLSFLNMAGSRRENGLFSDNAAKRRRARKASLKKKNP